MVFSSTTLLDIHRVTQIHTPSALQAALKSQEKLDVRLFPEGPGIETCDYS